MHVLCWSCVLENKAMTEWEDWGNTRDEHDREEYGLEKQQGGV